MRRAVRSCKQPRAIGFTRPLRVTTKLCGNVIAAVVKARAQRFKRVEQLGFVPSSSVYPTIGLMTHDDLPDVQREVQRLLGRCLVRLQQYERLMKSILAHHELSGPLHQLEAQRVERLESFATVNTTCPGLGAVRTGLGVSS
jgi:hypothetical protein